MLNVIYSRYGMVVVSIVGVLSLIYFLCIAPKEKALSVNVGLVSINTELTSEIENAEARLLICSLKRKSEAFERDMKGEEDEINAINDTSDTIIGKLIF